MARRKSDGLFAGIEADEELVMLGGIALVVWVIHSGGIQKFFQSLTQTAATAAANAAAALVKAAGQAANGVATGAVNAIGAQVGLPTSDQLTDDPYVARWIIDNPAGGGFAASRYSTSSAIQNALTIAVGAGVPPPAGSIIAATFPPYNQAAIINQEAANNAVINQTGDDGSPVYDAMGNQVF